MISPQVHVKPSLKASVPKPKWAPPAIPKQNGKWYTVLLAGGSLDVANGLRLDLAETRGIYVKYHWEYDKPGQNLPADVDFVILVKNFISHAALDHIQVVCKKASVRYIATSHSKNTVKTALSNYRILSSEPLPFRVERVEWGKEPKEKTPTQEILAIVPPLTATVEERVAAKESEPEPEITYYPPIPPPGAPDEPAPVAQEVPPPAAPQATDLSAVNIAIPPTPQVNIFSSPPPTCAEVLRPSTPTPKLAVLAAALWEACRMEGVSVILTPTSMEFTAPKA